MAKGVIDDFAEIIRGSTLENGEQLRAKPETIAALIVGLLNGLSNVEFETGEQYVKAGDLATIFPSAAIKVAPARTSRSHYRVF